MPYDENGRFVPYVTQNMQKSRESREYAETQLKGSAHPHVTIKYGEDPIKAWRKLKRIVEREGTLEGLSKRHGGGMGRHYETRSAKRQKKKKKREHIAPFREVQAQYDQGMLTEQQVRDRGYRLPGELTPKQKKKNKQAIKRQQRGGYY